MLKLQRWKHHLLFMLVIILALFVFKTTAAERYNCKNVDGPCNARGICHSKGFCVCSAEYYGE